MTRFAYRPSDRGPCRFDVVPSSGKASCTPVAAARQLFFTGERGAKASLLSRRVACPSGARHGFFTTEITERTEDGALQGNGKRQGDGEEWNR